MEISDLWTKRTLAGAVPEELHDLLRRFKLCDFVCFCADWIFAEGDSAEPGIKADHSGT